MGLVAGMSVLLAGGAYWIYSVAKRSAVTQATSVESPPLQSATTAAQETGFHDEHPPAGAGTANVYDSPLDNDATNRGTLKPPPPPKPVLAADSPAEVLREFGLTAGGFRKVTDEDFAPAVKVRPLPGMEKSINTDGMLVTAAVADPVSVFMTPKQALAALKEAQTIHTAPGGFVGVGVREQDAF
jgi:hypothetical protein